VSWVVDDLGQGSGTESNSWGSNGDWSGGVSQSWGTGVGVSWSVDGGVSVTVGGWGSSVGQGRGGESRVDNSALLTSFGLNGGGGGSLLEGNGVSSTGSNDFGGILNWSWTDTQLLEGNWSDSNWNWDTTSGSNGAGMFSTGSNDFGGILDWGWAN